MKEVIVAAAIRTSDFIVVSLPPPARHLDIRESMGDFALKIEWARQNKKVYTIPDFGEEGFLTSMSRFVTRTEAGKIALESGQINELEFYPTLYTEDLW